MAARQFKSDDELKGLPSDTLLKSIKNSEFQRYRHLTYVIVDEDAEQRCIAPNMDRTIRQCENKAVANGNGFCKRHQTLSKSIAARKLKTLDNSGKRYVATYSEFMARVAKFQKNKEIVTKNDEELAIQKMNIYKYIEEIERLEQLDGEYLARFKELVESQFFDEETTDDEDDGDEENKKEKEWKPYIPLDWPESAWLKHGPALSSMLEAYNRMKHRQHEILYGKKVTFTVEHVELVFNRFEFLVKDICGNDIQKLEKFAKGLKQMGMEMVSVNANN